MKSTPTRVFTRRRGLQGLLAAALALGGSIGHAAEPSEYSQAEKLVFVEPHLANVKAPTSLRYSFVKSGSMESGFEDEVRVNVTPGKRGTSLVHGNFLSGERRRTVPQVDEAEANPAILYFLEYDIREMERLTKGKAAYFQKRIRMAMVDAATVRDVRVNYLGRELPAREVSVAPYENDPMRSRYERYSLKRYVFVLAAVPGGLYQIRTTLPGALPGDKPVLEETMTLASAEPATAAPRPRKP